MHLCNVNVNKFVLPYFKGALKKIDEAAKWAYISGAVQGGPAYKVFACSFFNIQISESHCPIFEGCVGTDSETVGVKAKRVV